MADRIVPHFHNTPGVPVNITYGTTGRKDGPGKLTFNPSIADLSDSRELFLFDCRRQGVPAGAKWLEDVTSYEGSVLSKRS